MIIYVHNNHNHNNNNKTNGKTNEENDDIVVGVVVAGKWIMNRITEGRKVHEMAHSRSNN